MQTWCVEISRPRLGLHLGSLGYDLVTYFLCDSGERFRAIMALLLQKNLYFSKISTLEVLVMLLYLSCLPLTRQQLYGNDNKENLPKMTINYC